MTQANEIQQEFDKFAKSLRMAKHSGSWYRTCGDVDQVLELQKSQFGRNYYVNVALWLRTLGDTKFPKENQCHVRARLETLAADSASELACLLDLDCYIPDGERQSLLREFLQRRLQPFLDRATSVQALRGLHREGILRSAAIRGPALSLLETR